jgi:HEAT repeat protein
VANRGAPAFVFVLVVLGLSAGGWLLFRGSGEGVPANGPGAGGDPSAGSGSGPGGRALSREACLDLLKRHASPVRPPKGGGVVIVYEEVRMDALDALAAVAPAFAEPLVLAAMGGDGDPADWSLPRLHAAGLRIRAGQADGAETVRAYLKAEESLADTDVTVGAARAAAAMAPADGAGVVRRILAEKADAFDEEVLASVLQAAAALGDGATPEELKRHLASDAWLVRGAAAGALLRLGADPALRLGEDDTFIEGTEFARGLGVAGNERALPLLAELLKDEEPFTRIAAAQAVGAVGGPKAIAALKAVLKDPDPNVRDAGAAALALLGSTDDMAGVRRASKGRDPDVTVPAWKALALAGDAESRAAAEELLSQPPPKKGFPGTVLQQHVWAAALLYKTAK